jgi:hypothetical protein
VTRQNRPPATPGRRLVVATLQVQLERGLLQPQPHVIPVPWHGFDARGHFPTEQAARWRFIEHRQDPPLLPPGISWMQGASGIAAFLLRLARVIQDGLDAPVVDRPDQWRAVSARLRTVHTGPQVSSGSA